MKKVVLGMSGGVDSSVAAIILKNQGYEVIGITFKTLDNFDDIDAKNVAEKLNIEHHTIDIKDDFNKTIINSFINDYKNGITPNPCVLCNKSIKFKYLYEAMIEYKADYIATGHYASIVDGKLYMSSDLNKDQTYFLAEVNREILEKTLFPLDGITKDDVRKIAAENNLINAQKKDSYDVCFINDKFKDFMKDNSKNEVGDIIDISNGNIIGKHDGLSYYTIGQRKGLNIGGTSDKVYVVGKNINKNILYVSLGENNEYLLSNSALITNANFLTDLRPKKCSAKFRFRQSNIEVELEYLDDNNILVKYNNAKSVTPGQTCVFYIDNQCIGGGTISKVYKNKEELWYIS